MIFSQEHRLAQGFLNRARDGVLVFSGARVLILGVMLRSSLTVQNVLSQTKNGSIIMLRNHGGLKIPATRITLPRIIQTLKARGFEFMKLSEWLP